MRRNDPMLKDPVTSKEATAKPARTQLKRQRMARSLTVAGDGPNVPTPSRWIPSASFPVYPILSSQSLRHSPAMPSPNVLDTGPAIFVQMARYAIALALRAMGTQPGDRVLVPAYHCSAMVTPVLHLSATPIFYRIRRDLKVDLSDLLTKIDSGVRAVIAPHYFGFHQDLAELREVCDRNRIGLLEDCAHAYYGEVEGRPIGSYGDCTVASLWKFFPVPAGGCLISSKYPLDEITLRRPGIINDIKGFLKTVDHANTYGRLIFMTPISQGVELLAKMRRASRGVGAAGAPDLSAQSTPAGDSPSVIDSEFDCDAADLSSGTFCRALHKITARHGSRIANRRRHNYALLDRLLEKVPGCRPLFESLPDGVVPFMFPLWIDDLPEAFPRLEDAAVPTQRFGQFLWPGIDQTVCPVSASLSHYSVQLPCHQNLDDADIEQIVSTVEHALKISRS